MGQTTKGHVECFEGDRSIQQLVVCRVGQLSALTELTTTVSRLCSLPGAQAFCLGCRWVVLPLCVVHGPLHLHASLPGETQKEWERLTFP